MIDNYDEPSAQQPNGGVDDHRSVSDTDLQAISISDGTMDASWRYGNAGVGPSDVQMREMTENHKCIEASRAIRELGDLDLADLVTVDLRSDDATARATAAKMLRMSNTVGHLVNQGAKAVVNDAYMNPNEASMMMEQAAYQPQNTAGWQVVKKPATLKSGKQIAVFVVEDSLTGMTVSKRFRMFAVAEKIAMVMNATQNPSDARITMIETAYNTHVILMQKKAAANRAGNTKAVSLIESKLAEVNARLGLD